MASSQNEHVTHNRKRTDSNGDGKQGKGSSLQKQSDEFFYKPLHEYDRIQIATMEASDLLRAFRQWPDHIQLSIPQHVCSTIHQLCTSHEPELFELVGRYWNASLSTSARPTLLTLPGP